MILGSLIWQATFSGGGEAVLQSAAKWIDAEGSTITTVDATTPALRTGFGSAFGGLTITNQDGPESEPGVRLSDDTATQNRGYWCSSNVTNLSWGYCEIHARVRWYDNTNVWNGPGLAAFQIYSTFLQTTEPQDIDPELAAVYRSTAPYRLASWSSEDAGSDWRDLYLETHADDSSGAETNLTKVLGFRQNGSVAGLGGTIMDIASLTVTQRRASDIKDYRDAGTSAFTEATNNQRLVKSSTTWLASGPALVESWGSNNSGRLVDASTPDTILAVMHFHDAQPGADSNAITSGDIELVVDTDGNWHIVQSASDTDTGYPVASVPVCVGLVRRASTVELWIDGTLQHTESLTPGGSGMQILGGRAEGQVRSVATFESALSSAQIQAATASLRSRAGLPASWPLIAWGGQSNSLCNSNETSDLQASGLRAAPGYAIKRAEHGMTAFAWRTGNSIDYVDATTNVILGAASGWISAAQTAGDPCAVVSTGRGGAAATQWLSGGDMYTHTRTTIDAAIADFGTPLVHVDSWVWIQGEAEAANGAGTYLDDLRTIRTWVRSKWGSQVKWVGLKLATTVGASAIYAADVRTAQDTFAGEDSGTVYTQQNLTLVDDFHYSTAGRLTVGAALHAARQTI